MKLDVSQIDLDRTAFIWSRSALNVANELGTNVPELTATIRRAERSNLAIYPDGSLQFEGLDALELFEKAAGERIREHSVSCVSMPIFRRSSATPLGGAWYAGLEPFAQTRQYSLSLWGDFTSKNDGSHLLVRVGHVSSQFGSNPQCSIENLLITFVFHRKMSKKMKIKFAGILRSWLSDTGAFGTGPIVPVDDVLRIYDRAAQLRVNASKSEQDAINWLVLCLIEFCSINVVTRVCFTEKADGYTSFEDEYGLQRQEFSAISLKR